MAIRVSTLLFTVAALSGGVAATGLAISRGLSTEPRGFAAQADKTAVPFEGASDAGSRVVSSPANTAIASVPAASPVSAEPPLPAANMLAAEPAPAANKFAASSVDVRLPEIAAAAPLAAEVMAGQGASKQATMERPARHIRVIPLDRGSAEPPVAPAYVVGPATPATPVAVTAAKMPAAIVPTATPPAAPARVAEPATSATPVAVTAPKAPAAIVPAAAPPAALARVAEPATPASPVKVTATMLPGVTAPPAPAPAIPDPAVPVVTEVSPQLAPAPTIVAALPQLLADPAVEEAATLPTSSVEILPPARPAGLEPDSGQRSASRPEEAPRAVPALPVRAAEPVRPVAKPLLVADPRRVVETPRATQRARVGDTRTTRNNRPSRADREQVVRERSREARYAPEAGSRDREVVYQTRTVTYPDGQVVVTKAAPRFVERRKWMYEDDAWLPRGYDYPRPRAPRGPALGWLRGFD